MARKHWRVNKDRWHYPVFIWGSQLIARFKDKPFTIPERFNLCPYVRTVALWMPLCVFAYAGTFAIVIATMFILPNYLWGSFGFIYPTLVIIAVCLVVAVIIFAFYLVFELIPDTAQQMYFAMIDSYRERKVARMREREYEGNEGLWNLIRARAEAIHEGICPELEFIQTSSENPDVV